MSPKDKGMATLAILFGVPFLSWLLVLKKTEDITIYKSKIKAIYFYAKHTLDHPLLLVALGLGLILAILLIISLHHLTKTDFEGEYYKKRFRGSNIVTKSTLASNTADKKNEQVYIAGVPVPIKVEALHFLIGGSTGTGKTVLMRELILKIFLRKDRMIIVDPNADMLSKFYKKGDVILNPFDDRTEGWSFFNEIKNDYDFERLSLSLLPLGKTNDEEEWRSYGRLLLSETARKLSLTGTCTLKELQYWTTISEPDELQKFLKDTPAESMFTGADKALGSARFVLIKAFPGHLSMPNGDFSIRDWLADDNAGNLFITWREDMAESLKPLISSWVDIMCNSILSLPENSDRKIWLFLDELASLEKLPSLEPALTKGRKYGLRIVAGLQSTAQLDLLYGKSLSIVLRSCFRNLVVLGGSKLDSETCEVYSKSLGEFEIQRDKTQKSSGSRGGTRGENKQKERVIMPEEIASLPELTGYLAFAGNYPITRFTETFRQFKDSTQRFTERKVI